MTEPISSTVLGSYPNFTVIEVRTDLEADYLNILIAEFSVVVLATSIVRVKINF